MSLSKPRRHVGEKRYSSTHSYTSHLTLEKKIAGWVRPQNRSGRFLEETITLCPFLDWKAMWRFSVVHLAAKLLNRLSYPVVLVGLPGFLRNPFLVTRRRPWEQHTIRNETSPGGPSVRTQETGKWVEFKWRNYGLNDLGFEFRQVQEILIFSKTSRPVLGPSQPRNR